MFDPHLDKTCDNDDWMSTRGVQLEFVISAFVIKVKTKCAQSPHSSQSRIPRIRRRVRSARFVHIDPHRAFTNGGGEYEVTVTPAPRNKRKSVVLYHKTARRHKRGGEHEVTVLKYRETTQTWWVKTKGPSLQSCTTSNRELERKYTTRGPSH